MVLKKYLAVNFITYRAFASKVKIDAAQLARYAGGAHQPSLKNALKIHKATQGKVTFMDWFKPIPKAAKDD